MLEKTEQAAVVLWFRLQYAKYARSLRVSQSGMFRGKGRRGAIRMRQAQLQGVVPSECDIAILLPRGGFGSLLIEHKAKGSRHKATQEQIEYVQYHNSIGNLAVVTRGIESAMQAIEYYMELE